MKMFRETLRVETSGRGLVDIGDAVREVVARSGVRQGLCVAYCLHTSASLLIQENADPSVHHDLLAWWARLAPDGDMRYTHTAEGPDDMPAHLRGSITRTSECVPIVDGDLVLGTWQTLYLAEHRHAAHARRVLVHVQGV